MKNNNEANLHLPTWRVFKVLETVALFKGGITLSEIAEKTGIPKGTVFPIIQTLVTVHLLHTVESTQKYTLGIKTIEIGQRFFDHFDLLDKVKQEIHTIVEGCCETCHLGILEKGDVLYLHKEDSSKAIRMVSSIGKRLPAYGTGLGKALLSGLREDEVRDLYPDGLKAITPNTITNFNVLFAQLEKARLEGITYEKEESTLQIQCVAIPLRKDGKIQAALSVSIPVFRVTDSLIEKIQSLLLSSQARIETLMQNTNYDFTKIH